MAFNNLRLINNPSDSLPDWIYFASKLGTYLVDEGVKYRKAASVAVTVPDDQFFSLFAAVGIADKVFSVRKQMRSIRKQVLGLHQGSRVIHLNDKGAKKVSVISIEKSPYFKDEYLLFVQEGSMRFGIPERQWMDKIIILDEEHDEIKRMRKVNNNQKLRIDSKLLKELYSEDQLNKIAFYPGDHLYLIGSISQITELAAEKIFLYNGLTGSIRDFLYMDKKNSYTNGTFFSSQIKKFTEEIESQVPVLYSDANSFLKQAKHFQHNPSLIVISRTDHEHRIHEFKSEISRKLIQEENQLITDEVAEYLRDQMCPVPSSIEFIAWREK